ncbi:hypothetical protein Taro_005277 [Colocasia esculenta]|uniref:Uncharacterized protein n=1 Tax=Colocasia esculenta TaxID=4460 RepID=A0A843TPD0_COLES|nr:hypothetical protein [Colocasia esculenta]
MDVNDFSYEDEMDAAIVGVLSACVGVLEILVDNSEKAHPKDEPYINKSIDMCEELVVICGDDQATGSFSRTVVDSMVDVDSTSMDVVNEETSETPPPHRIVEDHSTSSEQIIFLLLFSRVYEHDVFGIKICCTQCFSHIRPPLDRNFAFFWK